MRFFLNERGAATIIQGLGLAAVVAVSALVTTRLLQDQKKLQKGVESRDQIEQMHRQIFSLLQNKDHCYATIAQETTAETAGITQDENHDLTNIWSVTSGTAVDVYKLNSLAGDTYMNGNVSLERIQLIPPSASAPTGERLITYPSKLRITYGRLEGNTAKKTKVGFGGKRISKDISILFQLGAPVAGRYPITGCYATQLADGAITDGNNNLNQDFCSNLGQNGSLFQWSSTENKCVLKNNVCPAKTIFAGILSNGNADCRPLSSYLGYMIDTAGASSCDTASGATVQLIQLADGKVSLNCISGGGGGCPAGESGWCNFRHRQCSPLIQLANTWSPSADDPSCQATNPGLTCLPDNELTTTIFACCAAGSSPTGAGGNANNSSCKCNGAGQTWNGSACI